MKMGEPPVRRKMMKKVTKKMQTGGNTPPIARRPVMTGGNTPPIRTAYMAMDKLGRTKTPRKGY